jgi:hypothetical protein
MWETQACDEQEVWTKEVERKKTCIKGWRKVPFLSFLEQLIFCIKHSRTVTLSERRTVVTTTLIAVVSQGKPPNKKPVFLFISFSLVVW